MRQNRDLRLIGALAFAMLLTLTISAKTTDFYSDLSTKKVISDKTIIWEQVAPGNAGYANLLRFHPTIAGKVATCPDMWNAYQSDNNGKNWYGITDYDGDGDFMHLRDLYFSASNPEFGLALGSSQLFQTADTGRTWQTVMRCPWYKVDADGDDTERWKKKVASLGLDPNNKNTWFVGGGSFVRGQEWLSCYQNVTAANSRGDAADNEGKMWRTTNAGSSWQLVNTGLNVKAQVGRIIINPRNSQQVFAASNYGIYRSNDGGTNWTQISSGKLDNDIIMDMDYYYNANTNTFNLYVIDQVQFNPTGTTTTCTGGIYRSTDEGNTWMKMNGDLGLNINRLTGGTSDSYYKFIAVWLGITEAVAKSTYPVLPTQAIQFFNMLSVDPSREGALYIGFADPQVANSFVPGRLWTTSNNGAKWINTARLYENVWKNDKTYWEERGNPWQTNMIVGHASPHMQSGNNYALRSMRALAVGVDGSVMIISDHSTMLSTDYGQSWKQVDEDVTANGNIIGRGNSNLPALTIGQDKRLDNMVLGSGEHRVWIPTNDSPDSRQAMKYIENAQESVNCLAFDPYNANTIYATSSRQATKQNIYCSNDGGFKWSNWGLATPATNKWLDDFYTNALTIDPIDNNYMYHGINKIVDVTKASQGGFFISKDHGKTFTQSNTGLPNPVRVKDIKIDPRDYTCASLFIAAEKNAFTGESPIAAGGLYHSTNRGESWTKIVTPTSVQGVNHIEIDHSNRIYITTGYRGAGDGVWCSDDFGKTWTQVFKYPGTECIAVSPFDRNLLVVTAKYLSKNPGVYVSRDRGVNWSKSNMGIVTPEQIEDIKFNIKKPGEIWLATLGTGFYKGKIQNGDDVQVVKVSPSFIDYRPGGSTKITSEIVNQTYAGEAITWKSDNPAIATVDAQGNIKPISRGKTRVWATAKDGRFADYCDVVVQEAPSGTKSIKNDKLKIAPTPTKETFSVSGAQVDSTVTICALNGAPILVANSPNNINISDLQSGMYLVRISDESDILKLIKD